LCSSEAQYPLVTIAGCSRGHLCVPSCSGVVIALVLRCVALAVGLAMGCTCDCCSAFAGGHSPWPCCGGHLGLLQLEWGSQ